MKARLNEEDLRRVEEILRPTKVLREAEVEQTRALQAQQA